MPLINTQRRLVELGRIRLGDKAESGAPRKLSTFRLTSASKALLEAAAKLYGGTVGEWHGAPADGYYELVTKATEIDVVIPPIPTLCSQWMEMWSKGGCTRRCDGVTEHISGDPCMCDPEADAKDRCKVTTRISVMLPRLAGLGLWRLDSHGWNAAQTLPGTIELLSSQGQFIPAVLRAEQRTEKKQGKTHKFVVPVIDVPGLTLGGLLAGSPNAPLLGGPVSTPANVRVPRPELAAPMDPPGETPAWNGDDAPATGGDATAGLLDQMDSLGKSTVDPWLKKNKATILSLDETGQSRVKARALEIRELPFD